MKITLIRFKRWGKSTKLDVKTKHFAILSGKKHQTKDMWIK